VAARPVASAANRIAALDERASRALTRGGYRRAVRASRRLVASDLGVASARLEEHGPLAVIFQERARAGRASARPPPEGARGGDQRALADPHDALCAAGTDAGLIGAS
jgi:hypothetical protein